MSSVSLSNEESSTFVADTVALVIWLEKRVMGDKAAVAFQKMENDQATIYIPGMVFAEIMYLSERNRIATSINDVQTYMKRYPICIEYPIGYDVVRAASKITDIPELHDRLIAATADVLKSPLITNDETIAKSGSVTTIWGDIHKSS